jgi:hypothetical protein
MNATAKILDLDPDQRLRRKTAELMHGATVAQIMSLLKAHEELAEARGEARGHSAGFSAATQQIDRFLNDEPPPSAA